MKRQMGAMERLPDRATPAERVATLDADVREAADKARKRIMDTFVAKGYNATGYSIDDESWTMAVVDRTVIVTVQAVRP